jgi:multiple sugar transport system substrate-binding protein
MRKKILAFAAFSALIGIGAGCSGTDKAQPSTEPNSVKPPETNAPAPKPPDPVTLKFAFNYAALTEEEIKMYIKDPVAKKYPHITLELINTADQGRTITDLVAGKEIPDIYAHYPLNLAELVDLKLAYNIEELVKKHKFDLNRLYPEFIESIKIGTGLDYLAGLPMYNQAFALFYNKDLFNKFGVDYPKDGMTWDQVRDLAVRMTRSESGTNYWGLWPDGAYRGAYQLSLPWGDFKNNKPVFQSDGWRELFRMWADLYKVPGHPPKGTNYTKEFNEGRLAMMAGSTTTLRNMLSVQNLDWDLVTYPQNPKAPGVGQRVDTFVLTTTSQSQHKDEAFQVIDTILSEEVQTLMSRNVRLSVLKDNKVQSQFSQNVSAFQGKNVSAFTELNFAVLQTFNNTPAASIIIQAFDSVLYNGKDINTALREADERMAQEIEKLKNR